MGRVANMRLATSETMKEGGGDLPEHNDVIASLLTSISIKLYALTSFDGMLDYH